jgi:siroheme synthase (precorrin-2 oxidase/ferrochelatase)
MVAKLFVVVRADLSPGQQAVQGLHALQEFNEHHPLVTSRWYTTSNTLAMLCIPDERALGVLLRKAEDRRIPVSAFREPDRGNEMTALVLGPEGKRLTQGLRLAYHDHREKGQPDHPGE